MNHFINKLNLLHVEVYQNEISLRLPTLLLSVIVVFTVIENLSELKSEMKKIENSSGMHFFV